MQDGARTTEEENGPRRGGEKESSRGETKVIRAGASREEIDVGAHTKTCLKQVNPTHLHMHLL